jgi:5-hydroxyisourate hydrolase-like protein (transthyretin family)
VKLNIRGTDNALVAARMQRLGEKVFRGVKARLKQLAEHVREEAELNAPVDEGNLELSIQVVPHRDERRRMVYDVVAGGTVDGVDVNEYVVLMHENYEEIISAEETDKQGRVRRKNTKAKQAANPDRYVGGKFLERAATDAEKNVQADFTTYVKELIDEEGFDEE